MQKKLYFHTTAAVKQTKFKKSTKQTKSILVVVQDLKILGIDLFLNI